MLNLGTFDSGSKDNIGVLAGCQKVFERRSRSLHLGFNLLETEENVSGLGLIGRLDSVILDCFICFVGLHEITENILITREQSIEIFLSFIAQLRHRVGIRAGHWENKANKFKPKKFQKSMNSKLTYRSLPE